MFTLDNCLTINLWLEHQAKLLEEWIENLPAVEDGGNLRMELKSCEIMKDYLQLQAWQLERWREYLIQKDFE
jgi:hypothetical protein